MGQAAAADSVAGCSSAPPATRLAMAGNQLVATVTGWLVLARAPESDPEPSWPLIPRASWVILMMIRVAVMSR